MSTDSESLICPITQEVFRDPVIAEDGRLYERAAITRWINEHGTSPFTRQVLNANHLQPDNVIRRRAEERHSLPKFVPRQLNQVRLPAPQRTTINVFPNPITDVRPRPQPTNRLIQNNGSYRVRNKSIGCVCLFTGICGLSLFIVLVGIQKVLENITPTYPIRYNITTFPALCYPLNTKLQNDSCISSFTSIRTLDSGTCISFTYRRVQCCFNASQPSISIILALQQTSGYWDIDNIELKSYGAENIFRNGAFETGSLFPHYSQCQSTGYIQRVESPRKRYYYSDGTRGQFGYLAQVVSIITNVRYCLSFDLQNRNGLGGSFMVLLGN